MQRCFCTHSTCVCAIHIGLRAGESATSLDLCLTPGYEICQSRSCSRPQSTEVCACSPGCATSPRHRQLRGGASICATTPLTRTDRAATSILELRSLGIPEDRWRETSTLATSARCLKRWRGSATLPTYSRSNLRSVSELQSAIGGRGKLSNRISRSGGSPPQIASGYASRAVERQTCSR